MLLYVVFILLPATALAICEKGVYYDIFNAVDKFPADDKVDHFECTVIFDLLDADLSNTITLEELEARICVVAPALKGDEPTTLTFMDHNNNSVIDKDDINIDFDKIDTNHDGVKTLAEYTIYVDKYCTELEDKQAKASGEGDNNSVSGEAERK